MTEQMKEALDKAAKGLQWSQGSMLIDKETLQPADPAVVPLNRLVHLSIPDKLDMAAHFGANWYRNNIWHDVTEVPDSNMELLVITEPFDAPCVMTSNSDRFRDRAKQWAYIEDLLPTPGYKDFQSKIKTE